MPPSRTAATRRASPVPSSVSTAIAHSVAGPVRRLEFALRDAAQEAGERLVLVHADHRLVVAGHADIGHEGGAAGQDALVGGRHMGVGADHEARAAVGEIAHRLLLAGRLGMHVDDDGVGVAAERAGGEFALDRGERIVERVHEDAAHGVDHQHARAVLGLDHGGAAPGRAGRIVERTDQPRRALDEHQRLALVPGMVAERDGVGAGVEEILIDRLGDAEAAGGILAVDDDEIELPVGDQAGQALQHDRPAAAPHHVADKQNSHITSCGSRSLRAPLARDRGARRAA